MSVQDIVKEISNELERIVDTKTVVGEPIQAADRTIIPITQISVGFASGGFDGAGEKNEPAGAAKAFGGGGGGGAKIEPIAFIILSKEKSEILTIREARLESDLLQFFETVPTLVEKIKSSKKGKEETAKNASE